MVINSPCLTDKKELAILGKTTTGKESSNPLIADSLLKTVCTHISTLLITSLSMAQMGFCDKHNMVAFLQKPTRSEEFHQIVDFLAGSHIRYALTANPTIYVSLIEQFWQTATVETVNDGEQQITVTVDGHTFAITQTFVRRHLQLADVDGLSSLPNTEIFEQLTLMGQGEGPTLPVESHQTPTISPPTTHPTTSQPTTSHSTSSPEHSS
ncbi:hypothetical protein Tco_0493056 [Tanacetum coccineum]